MAKAVFLDRDGTINEDAGYTKDIDAYKLLPGVIEGLKILKEMGFKLIVVTNQAGIGKGYYTEEKMHRFHDHMTEDLRKHGIELDGIYFCPHHPDHGCTCRKPNTGMIDKAKEDLDIDVKRSYMIGDKETDITLAHKAGMKGIATIKNENTAADYVAKDMIDAANFIKKEAK